MTKKDKSIRHLVAALKLEERAWVINDPWEADLFAIGIARGDRPPRRVYVSTWKKPKGRYYYECETPTGPDPTDYEVIDEAEDVDFDTLLRAMTKHLSRRGK